MTTTKVTTKRNGESGETTNRPRLSREEIMEKGISMARKRGARVLRINSPLGNIMFNVLRQFDQAYANFKGKLGEPGGISYEEGAALMERAREITIDFSELTKQLSKKVDFRYYTPDELKQIGAVLPEKMNEQEQTPPL